MVVDAEEDVWGVEVVLEREGAGDGRGEFLGVLAAGVGVRGRTISKPTYGDQSNCVSFCFRSEMEV